MNPDRAIPVVDDNAPSNFGEHNLNPPPPPPPPPIDLKSDKKSTGPRRRLIEKKEEKPKFSIGLSLTEIKHDFIAITGKKPRRKSKS